MADFDSLAWAFPFSFPFDDSPAEGFWLPGGAAFPATVGKTAIDPSTRTVRTYLGFPFDNNTLWNAGLRDATLELDTDGSEGTRRIVFDLREVWPASHAPRTLVPAASSAQPSVSPSAPSTAPAHDGGVP